MTSIIRFINRVTKGILICFFVLGIIIVVRGADFLDASKHQPLPAFAPDPEDISEPEPDPTPKWEDNIMPETENKIYLTWAYRPREYQGKPPGVNVLAPTWFYVEDENDDGIPRLKDITELGLKADLKAYVDQSHDDEIQVWGTIVSFTPSLTDSLIHIQEYKDDFIEKTAGRIEDLGLDGINFDFENMNPEHKLDFTQFIKDCKEAWKDFGITISVDVTVKTDSPQPGNWFQSYDHKSLGETVDYVAVMAYDQHGNHSSAGPVASLEWVDRKVRSILEDVPSNKILLGIPFYGRDFPYMAVDKDADILIPTWSSASGGVVTVLKRHIDEVLDSDKFNDINNKDIEVDQWLAKNEWVHDDGVSYLKFIDKDGLVHEIWYEDETSLILKADLVNKYHLAGAAIWQQAFGSDSLWEAVESKISPENN